MLNLTHIRNMAIKEKARIGIGDETEDGVIDKSIGIAQSRGFAEVEIFHDARELLNALASGDIDGAVRGTFEAKSVMDLVKERFGVESVQRIALLVTTKEQVMLLAPVGVDEGQSLSEKKELAVFGRELLVMLGEKPKFGVLSGGRLEDYGRHPVVDSSLDMGRLLTEQISEMGVEVEHYGILLEKATLSSNFILAPDGISGNLIFRALHFFGGAKAIGAPLVNVPRVFLDTSRAKDDYSDSIALASGLSGLYCHHFS
jgi:putative methanogen marker protein 4